VTAIEWTDATWNPVTGCSRVSPGCDHCYAETLSLRFGWSKKPWTPGNAAENVVLHPERLRKPLSWREPRMVFVISMSDLFHERIPTGFLRQVLDVMEACPQHTFQVLTKRPERALAHLSAYRKVLPNVWVGVSIETAQFAWRASVLREVPAAVRFISAEPLLGSLFDGGRAHWNLDLTGIDWLIAGGESGYGYRPMREEWALELRDACLEAGTAFFFKQWGGRTPKSGGKVLDGREWCNYPSAVAA
jgi:protein gp37